jgi:hypothetical protein
MPIVFSMARINHAAWRTERSVTQAYVRGSGASGAAEAQRFDMSTMLGITIDAGTGNMIVP